MILETVKSDGLAHLSYVLGDDRKGVCVVIDPRRDVDLYLDFARRADMHIIGIIETHIQSDFVSGARELAVAAGAPIYAPASEEYDFEHEALGEGDTVEVGGITLRVLEAPGHSPEHISLLVEGGQGLQAPWAVFTGDTLFASEVGRPDLLGPEKAENLARQLFHSLHEKLLCLEEGTLVYPAHGEGSPCGVHIGGRDVTTIGYERQHNPRLRSQGEADFARDLLSALPPAPGYYRRVRQVNAAGPRILGCVPSLQPLSMEEFRSALDDPEAMVLDTRSIESFAGAHIPGALNIALRENFPIWAGWLIRPERRLLLVVTDENEAEIVERHLLRVGLECTVGFLHGGMSDWFEAGLPFSRMLQMSVQGLRDRVVNGRRDGLQVVDVRSRDEWEEGHIPRAKHIYLPEVSERMGELDRDRPVAVYCSTGFRAAIAASMLQANGFREVHNVPGSMKAWRAAGYPIER